MNALQQYLRSCTPEEHSQGLPTLRLSERFGIACRRHPKFPELCLFKYSQIDSPMADPIVQASRGIILNAADNWNVVAHSFNKFFNFNEPLAAALNWDRAVVQEKLDGSLIQMYYYGGAWRVASSGSPDAGGDVNGHGITFAQLFWKTFAAQGLSLDDLNEDYEESALNRGWERFTFAWELTTPLNRVVVDNREPRVTLIGIRDNLSGREYAVISGPTRWPRVKHYGFLSRDTVVSMMNTLDPLRQEGFVVVDDQWNRVKMKSDQYVNLHHMRGNGAPTPKRALAAILAGETSEVLAAFPEWKDLFADVETRLSKMVFDLEVSYEDAIQKVADTQFEAGVTFDVARIAKEFAFVAVKSRCSGALFAVRSGKAKSIDAYLRALSLDALANLLNLKETKSLADLVDI